MIPARGEIRLDGLTKRFRLYHQRATTFKEFVLSRGTYEDLFALREVDLAIRPGESVGIVGSNGSGKTTLLKIVSRVLVPTFGRVVVGGRIGSLLELGAGFHHEMTGRENVFLYGSILGMTRREIASRFDGIVAFAELERFIDAPLRSYSSGMVVRLGFAVAVHVDPDILLVDEVLAVGDERFQRRCLETVTRLHTEGRTVVVVSHDLDQIERFCERVVWIREGRVVADGTAAEGIAAYRETAGEAG